MKRVIVILLVFLFISCNNKKHQNISVSSEEEKMIHNDIIATKISNNVNFELNHPYKKICNEYLNVAVFHHLDCGIPVSIQFAQAIIESGFGKSNIAKNSNNLFGMKYYKQIFKGDYYISTSGTKWRKYDSFEDSFDDHAKFLFKYYPNAVGKNWKYWVDYCTGYGGENYWQHIGKVITLYELWKYDGLVTEYKNNKEYYL